MYYTLVLLLLLVGGTIKGPPEYCRDGTVARLNYNKLLHALVHYNRNSDRTLEAPGWRPSRTRPARSSGGNRNGVHGQPFANRRSPTAVHEQTNALTSRGLAKICPRTARKNAARERGRIPHPSGRRLVLVQGSRQRFVLVFLANLRPSADKGALQDP